MSFSTSLLKADVTHIGALAVPLILTQFAQVALSTTGVVMMGWLGPLDIAAGGLALAVFNLLRTTGVGLVTPTGNLVATAAAAGLETPHVADDVRDMVRASFTVATLAGLAFWALMLGAGHALRWMGQDATVVARTADYLFAAAPGILPLLWFQALRNFTVGLRRPGPLLAITLAAVAVNIVLNYVLTTGAFGMAGMGLAGIALSSTLVHLFSFVMLLLVVRRDPALARLLSVRIWKTSAQALKRTWTMGLPVAATYGSEAGFFAVIALLVGSLGADALAAHTVVNQVVYIVFMISVGLSHATSICISRTWAQGDIATSRRYGYTGLGMGVACMTLVGLFYAAAPQLVLAAFLRGSGAGNDAVLLIAGKLILLAAVLQVFDCAQNIGIGILRGAGETGSSFVMTLIGYWAVGLPGAWLLGHWLGLGATGVWLGLTLGLVVTAAQLVVRFHRLIAQRTAGIHPADYELAQ
nr:MATE family efflux transporter [Herbaspirillum sp. ASV7]